MGILWSAPVADAIAMAITALGGIIYALKLPLFTNKNKYFGNHELFHLFCIGGSLCHYIMMLAYVSAM